MQMLENWRKWKATIVSLFTGSCISSNIPPCESVTILFRTKESPNTRSSCGLHMPVFSTYMQLSGNVAQAEILLHWDLPVQPPYYTIKWLYLCMPVRIHERSSSRQKKYLVWREKLQKPHCSFFTLLAGKPLNGMDVSQVGNLHTLYLQGAKHTKREHLKPHYMPYISRRQSLNPIPSGWL